MLPAPSTQGQRQTRHEEPRAPGRGRGRGGQGRVEDAELLALLPLLHALGQERIVVLPGEGLVELLGALVVPGGVQVLLLPLRRVVEARLVRGDPLPQPLLVLLGQLELGVDLAERVLQPRHLGGGWARDRLGIGLRLGVGHVLLEALDLVLDPDDVRPQIGVLHPERDQLLLQPGQADLVGLGPARVDLGLGELARDGVPPLGQPDLVVVVDPQLRVQRVERGQVALQLLGQLAQVPALELAHAGFLLVEPALGVVELHLEELGGAGGLPLAGLQVLLDVERGQRVRDDRDRLRISPAIGEGERGGHAPAIGVGSAQLEADVPAHPVDRLLARARPLQIGVEAHPGDQGLEPRAAQDLLADGVQPDLELAGHGGAHERLRDLLPLDHHERGGLVEVRQAHDHRGRGGEGQEEHDDPEPLPAVPEGPDAVEPAPARRALVVQAAQRVAHGRCALRRSRSRPLSLIL